MGLFRSPRPITKANGPHEVRSVPPSALHSLRPYWTNFLSILRGRVLLSKTSGPLDFRQAGLVFPSLLDPRRFQLGPFRYKR